MTDAGDPLLLPTDGAPRLRCRGIEFYAPDDPAGSADRRAASAALQPDTLVFVPSVGLGYGLPRLLARLPAGCAVICVEVDEQVMRLARAAGLPTGDSRLAVVRTADQAAACLALRSLGPRRFRRVTEVPLCAGYRIAPGRYRAIRAALEEELAASWRNRLTLVALGPRLLRNLFDNLPMMPQARDAARLATGQPVVVAGAGPSLALAFPALARHRRRFCLAACDTALPALAAAGIVPDLVVCLEAQQANLADFLPCRHPRIALACELAGFPPIPRLFADRLWFFSSSFAPVALLDRLAGAGLRPLAVPALGSVGVAAAHLALRMTDSAVVLCGLDFACPGGMTHVRGAPAHLASLAASSRLAPVGHPSVASLLGRVLLRRDGLAGPVATDQVLAGYRDTVARLVAVDASARSERRTFELAGGGLGTGAVPLGDRALQELLGSYGEQRREAPGDTADPRPWGAEALGAFLAAEGRLIEDGRAAARALLGRAGAPAPGPREQAVLRALDYAWMPFPDQPDLDAPDPGFVGRLERWLGVYAERTRRALLRLGGEAGPA